jgi:hypothetical protein
MFFDYLFFSLDFSFHSIFAKIVVMQTFQFSRIEFHVNMAICGIR